MSRVNIIYYKSLPEDPVSCRYIGFVGREHERHLGQLRNLEEELDSQVARVEAKAREEARQKFEHEKKTITKKMETEIMELQTHLRLFKKVQTFLS